MANRLREFLAMRHMLRSTTQLEALYPDPKQREMRSLLGNGNFGTDGEFFLPEVVVSDPWAQDDWSADGVLAPDTPPGNCPCLYTDLTLVPAEDGHSSYLCWTQADDTYCMAEWLQYLAPILVHLGYHLDGLMLAMVDDGAEIYQIKVSDAVVVKERLEPTYCDEILAAQTAQENRKRCFYE